MLILARRVAQVVVALVAVTTLASCSADGNSTPQEGAAERASAGENSSTDTSSIEAPLQVFPIDVPSNSGVFRGVAIETLGAIASNAKPQDILQGDPIADRSGGTWVTIRVGVRNTTDITFYSDRTNWVFVDPDGASSVALALLNADGTNATTPIEPQASGEMYIAYETNALLTDLDDWAFGIATAREVPELFSLSALQTVDYPVELDVESEMVIVTEDPVPVNSDPCERRLGALEVTVTDAVAQIEPINVGSQAPTAVRSDTGTRWFIVRAHAKNISPSEPITITSCSSTLLPTYEMTLLIDGQPYSDIGDGSLMSGSSGLSPGAEADLTYRFVIPADGRHAALVWGDKPHVVEVWDLALPPVAGE